MLNKLIKLSHTLESLGFDKESNAIKKIASKASAKKAKGLNWSAAEAELLKSNIEPSREAIQKIIAADQSIWLLDEIQEIYDIKIEDDFGKILNKNEKIFIEIGAWERGVVNQLNEIKDYLIHEKGVSRPGDLFKLIDVDMNDSSSIISKFKELDEAQDDWHEEARIRDQQGLGRARYLTHDVVHDFGDGWVIVYVPSAKEGPNWKGNKKKSNDRTHEGNLLGLCLGETQGLYQSNESGKIYSVRDPKNKPHVTIRKTETNLYEAKGKNNISPSIEGAIHADKWFKLLKNLHTSPAFVYKDNGDYKSFPPLTLEKAEVLFRPATVNPEGQVIIGGRFYGEDITDENVERRVEQDKERAYKKGWISHWYKKGSKLIDSDVENRIKNNDKWIIYSGFGKKHKEVAQPVVKYWTKKYIKEKDDTIFSQGPDPLGENLYRLSHESWKTYKKEPWMQDAVKKLSEDHPAHMFKLGINRIYQYIELVRPAAKRIANDNPNKFFHLKIQETHPRLGEAAAKSLSEVDPATFLFKYKLHETYSELGEPAVRSLAEKKPNKFFNHSLQETYPELEEPAARNLIKTSPRKFFDLALQETYPDLGEPAARNVIELSGAHAFFSRKLHETYHEIGRPLATKMVEATSKHWIHTRDDLGKHGLTPNSFFDYKLHETYPQLGEMAAKNLAETGPNSFFKYDLEKSYNKYGEIAVSNLSNKATREWLEQDKGKNLFILYPEAARNAAAAMSVEKKYEYGGEVSPHMLFFTKELDKIYPDIAENAINDIINDDAWVTAFFKRKIYRRYPEHQEKAAKKWLGAEDNLSTLNNYSNRDFFLDWYTQEHMSWHSNQSSENLLKDVASQAYKQVVAEDKEKLKMFADHYSDSYLQAAEASGAPNESIQWLTDSNWRRRKFAGDDVKMFVPMGEYDVRSGEEQSDIKLLEEQLSNNEDGIMVEEVVAFFDALRSDDPGASPRAGLFVDTPIMGGEYIKDRYLKSLTYPPIYFNDVAIDFIKEIAAKDPMYLLNINKLVDGLHHTLVRGRLGRRRALDTWKTFISSDNKEAFNEFAKAHKKLSLIQKNLFSSDLFKNHIASKEPVYHKNMQIPPEERWKSENIIKSEEGVERFFNFLKLSPTIKPGFDFAGVPRQVHGLDLPSEYLFGQQGDSAGGEFDDRKYKLFEPAQKAAYGAIAPIIADKQPYNFLKYKMHKIFPELSDNAFKRFFELNSSADLRHVINIEHEGNAGPRSQERLLSRMEKLMSDEARIFDGPIGERYLDGFIDKYPKMFISLYSADTKKTATSNYIKRALKIFSVKHPADFIMLKDKTLADLGVYDTVLFPFFKDLKDHTLKVLENYHTFFPPDLLPEDETISPEEIPIGLDIEEVGEYRAKDIPRTIERPSFEDLWFRDTEKEEAEQEETARRLISEEEERRWDDILDKEDEEDEEDEEDKEKGEIKVEPLRYREIPFGRKIEDIGSYDQYRSGRRRGFPESRIAKLKSWLKKNGCDREIRLLDALLKQRRELSV